MATTIEHNPGAHRFDIFLDGELAGYAEYAEHGRVRDFNHTLTFPQFRGKGLAAEVVRYALDSSRADGFSVRPTCWYVEQYVAEHPEYRDLVA